MNAFLYPAWLHNVSFSYELARKRLNFKFFGGVPGNYVYAGMNTTGGCKKYIALSFYKGKQT